MTTTSATSSSLDATAQAFLPLIEQVRVHRVLDRRLDPHTFTLTPPSADKDAIVVDAHNGLADVDARLSLSVVAARLLARGWLLPLVRPLPSTPLWRLAMTAPFFIDACAQQATLITVDGDVFSTPKAPRHSAGPSMLHATTTAVPFAFVTRVKLRLMPLTHATVSVESHEDVSAVAARVRALVDEARAFGVDARGNSIVVVSGAPARTASTLPGPAQDDSKNAPWTTPRARWSSSRSIHPGDVTAIAAALKAGHRVAAVPFLQRAAVLQRVSAPAVGLLDVRGAAAALADALRTDPLRRQPHREPGRQP